MRMKHFLLAAPLLLGSWQPVLADTNPFGTASDYNKFILGDMTHYGGDSEGAVAIAGDAELVNYGIADRTPNVINGLVVGGSLTQSNGQTFAGDVHVAGSVNNISTILSGSLQNPSSPIDFNQEATSLRALSTFWQQLPTNGALNLQGWGGLELTGTDNDLNVFSITEAQWKGTRQINLSVPASSSVIINVEGTADSIPSDHSWFGAMFFNNSTNAADWQKVIWNFPNMTTFSIQNIGWKGTLFAPNADFTYASGNVEGHLIVNSVSALQSSAETHWYPFTGDVPVPEATDDANAGADDNSDDVDNSGNAGACNIAGGDAVTLAAGGPGAKETDYTITFEGAAGNTWTYSVYREAGSDARTLSHWSLGMGSCNVVSTTGSGAQTGNGGSANADGVLAGQPLVKWNTDVSTDPSNPTVFTFTLDGNYGAASVPVIAKTGGRIKIDGGTITGPDCSIPAPTDCDDSNSDETDSGAGDNSDETDGDTASGGDSKPITLTCPDNTSILGHFDWNGANYVLNGENVGGIAITGGVEGVSTADANWAASAGTVSAVLVASSDNSATDSLNDVTSGHFSNTGLNGDDIASVMFCGTEGEQDSLAVALPAQGSVVGRVWALACEENCDEFLNANEAALDDADHVLEVVQPNGQVLFVPVSILK